MYADSGSALVPRATICEPCLAFWAARSAVGSSSLRPLMKTRSARASTLLTCGGGS